MPASALGGRGRFGEADLLVARLAVDRGGPFGDPGSANAVLPETFGAAHLKDGLPIAGIGIVSRRLPVAGGHDPAFISAVMGNRASQRTVMEIGAKHYCACMALQEGIGSGGEKLEAGRQAMGRLNCFR